MKKEDKIFAFIIALIIIIGFTSLTLLVLTKPPSIYKNERPINLLRYLASDNHIMVENLTQHFANSRDAIITELSWLNDGNYVERVFEDGLCYYRLTEWGVVYLNYLETGGA